MEYVDAVLAAVEPTLVTGATALRGVLPPDLVASVDTYVAENQDPLSKGFALMDPFQVAVIFLCYMAMVLVGRVVMPLVPGNGLPVKPLMIVHNMVLVVLSGYMCFESVMQARILGFSLWGNAIGEGENRKALAKVLWIFYASKILEFTDTLIMLLKKNFRQVSFLHVYHHGTIFPIWWWIVCCFPGGDSYFSCAQNSFIHVIMYSYYLAAALGFSLPFKFIVTQGQMLQFLLNLFQALYVSVVDTGYPKAPAYLLLGYMITLLILFGNFYRKNAPRGGRKPAGDAKAADDKKTN